MLFRQTFPFSHHSGLHSVTVSRKNKLNRADLKTCNYLASQWSKICNAWSRMWIYTAICRKQIGKLIGYQYSSNWKCQKANIGMQVWYKIRWKRERDIYATTPLWQLTDSAECMLYLREGMPFLFYSLNVVLLTPFRRKTDALLFLPHPLNTILQPGGTVIVSCMRRTKGAHSKPSVPAELLGRRSAAELLLK